MKKGIRKVDVVAFIDSGADKSVISQRIAKQLGLKPKRREKIVVANGEVISASVDKIRIISTRDNIDTEMYVDITDVPFDLDIDEIDMKIGIDFLQKNRVKLVFVK